MVVFELFEERWWGYILQESSSWNPKIISGIHRQGLVSSHGISSSVQLFCDANQPEPFSSSSKLKTIPILPLDFLLPNVNYFRKDAVFLQIRCTSSASCVAPTRLLYFHRGLCCHSREFEGHQGHQGHLSGLHWKAGNVSYSGGKIRICEYLGTNSLDRFHATQAIEYGTCRPGNMSEWELF